jgi:hypothetical protein
MLSRYKEAYTDRHRTQVFGSLLGAYCPIYALPTSPSKFQFLT